MAGRTPQQQRHGIRVSVGHGGGHRVGDDERQVIHAIRHRFAAADAGGPGLHELPDLPREVGDGVEDAGFAVRDDRHARRAGDDAGRADDDVDGGSEAGQHRRRGHRRRPVDVDADGHPFDRVHRRRVERGTHGGAHRGRRTVQPAFGDETLRTQQQIIALRPNQTDDDLGTTVEGDAGKLDALRRIRSGATAGDDDLRRPPRAEIAARDRRKHDLRRRAGPDDLQGRVVHAVGVGIAAQLQPHGLPGTKRMGLDLEHAAGRHAKLLALSEGIH